jgi:hypothetical protein
MSRTLRYLVFVCAAIVCAAASMAADIENVGFVSGMEDLPLTPGLVGIQEEGMVFDAPTGRIVEAYAGGTLTKEQVLGFYRETLPQLGWRLVNEKRFVREEEVLRIEFIKQEAKTPAIIKVRFSLSPKGSGD